MHSKRGPLRRTPVSVVFPEGPEIVHWEVAAVPRGLRLQDTAGQCTRRRGTRGLAAPGLTMRRPRRGSPPAAASRHAPIRQWLPGMQTYIAYGTPIVRSRKSRTATMAFFVASSLNSTRCP